MPPRTALTFAAIWDEDFGRHGHVLWRAPLGLGDGGDGSLGPVGERLASDVVFGVAESQVLTINDRFAIAIFESLAHSRHVLPSTDIDSLTFTHDAMIDGDTAICSRSFLTPGGLRVPPGIHYAPDSPMVASSMALTSLANLSSCRTLMNNPFSRAKRESQARCSDLRVQTNKDAVDCPISAFDQ